MILSVYPEGSSILTQILSLNDLIFLEKGIYFNIPASASTNECSCPLDEKKFQHEKQTYETKSEFVC
jgi:hypothetical protein